MSTPDPTPTAAPAALPRTLSAWTAAFAVTGIIIGGGIFRLPGSVAASAGAPWAILAVWVAGGVLTLCLALLLAELSAMLPRVGGMYQFLREAYGETIAFIYGWTYLLVNPAAWASIAVPCAEFIGYFVPLTEFQRRLTAMGIIFLLCALNYRSATLGGRVQGLGTATKVLALVLLLGAVALFGGSAGLAGTGAFAAGAPAAPPVSLSGLLVALVAVLWAYEGAVSACSLSGEVRDPQRSMPRALIMGVGAVVTLYLAVNLAILWVLPLTGIAGQPLALSAAIAAVLGPWASNLLALLMIIATLSSLAGCTLADPRVFYSMAHERQFFAVFGKAHPRFKTPANAIVLHGLLACVYASARTFEELAATFILGLVPFYTLGALAVLRLRRKRPDAPRPFRAPFAPLLAVTWTLAAILLMGNAALTAEKPSILIINIAISLAGWPVFVVWRRIRDRAAEASA